jgi:hypothetical protein
MSANILCLESIDRALAADAMRCESLGCVEGIESEVARRSASIHAWSLVFDAAENQSCDTECPGMLAAGILGAMPRIVAGVYMWFGHRVELYDGCLTGWLPGSVYRSLPGYRVRPDGAMRHDDSFAVYDTAADAFESVIIAFRKAIVAQRAGSQRVSVPTSGEAAGVGESKREESTNVQ